MSLLLLHIGAPIARICRIFPGIASCLLTWKSETPWRGSPLLYRMCALAAMVYEKVAWLFCDRSKKISDDPSDHFRSVNQFGLDSPRSSRTGKGIGTRLGRFLDCPVIPCSIPPQSQGLTTSWIPGVGYEKPSVPSAFLSAQATGYSWGKLRLYKEVSRRSHQSMTVWQKHDKIRKQEIEYVWVVQAFLDYIHVQLVWLHLYNHRKRMLLHLPETCRSPYPSSTSLKILIRNDCW